MSKDPRGRPMLSPKPGTHPCAAELRRLRAVAELSQEQVARAVGVSRQTYGQYEGQVRRPSAETLSRLAAFFKVELSTLITGRDASGEPLQAG